MNWSIQRHSYGVALIFAGLPIVWILRALVNAPNSQIYSIVAMILGLCLIVYPPKLWKCTLEVIFPPLTQSFWQLVPLLFLIPALVASFLANIPDDLGGVYILFLIAFLIAFNTVPYERLKFLPQACFVISATGCLVVLLYALKSGIGLSGQRLTAAATNSPGQIAYMGGTALISGIATLNHLSKSLSSLLRNYAYAAIMLGTAVVILAVSRSTLIGLSLCLLFALFNRIYYFAPEKLPPIHLKIKPKKSWFSSTELKLIIWAVILIFAILYWENLLLTLSPVAKTFNTYQERFWTYLQKGYQTYAEGTGTELSAGKRRALLTYAISNFDNLGHGYKSLWVDCPLAQAFYDGGLLGGLLFLAVALIIPVACIANLTYFQPVDPIKSICIYLYIFSSPTLVLHGQPYDFYFWLRIVIIYSVMSKINSFRFRKTSRVQID
ncbi:hypothetical protein [Merismopedia glauca]|uniref:O-antigen polymerase n=1 Tax=Merismopedia glauca CCAP 1448/3 TaxID=1296344 RepID=A0A2T1C7E9_9CYAN|nr:hypothetical protein [Merismopedia glauca]PSB04088.1 hypothetical protein C7B64_05490 [Merismopedia glauca CCAP 1448/3]